MTMTHEQREVLGFLVETLNAAAVPFQVSGGLAAICHGATRPLYDIDLDIHARDMPKVRALFAAHMKTDRHRYADPDDVFDLWLMTLSVRGVLVDISQLEESYIFDAARRRIPLAAALDAEPMELNGLILPVQRKESLVAYKRIAARKTDLSDVAELFAADNNQTASG